MEEIKKMSLPTIVIVAYNRPESLRRLLISLANANFEKARVNLHISIDRGGEMFKEVLTVSESFSWLHGEKFVEPMRVNQGLKNHVILCASLTFKYGSIVLLEDDHIVSKGFYSYLMLSISRYKDDSKVAGISLYNYEYSEISRERFYPFIDGSDVYFIQWPSSRGLVLTKEQWQGFMEWYESPDRLSIEYVNLPSSVRGWPESSWKKYHLAYLIEMNKHLVYPRMSLCTPVGDTGTHSIAGTTPIIQSALLGSDSLAWRLKSLDDSFSVYDSYFQPSPRLLNKLCPELYEYDYTVDLQGNKDLDTVNSEYLLSIRKCSSPVRTFGWNLFPIEMNIGLNMPGRRIYFGKTELFQKNLGLRRYSIVMTWSKRLLGPKDFLLVFIGKCLNRIWR